MVEGSQNELIRHRLPPERALGFYIRLAQRMLEVKSPAAIGIAIAAIKNAQDSIAQLQEHT